VEERIRRISKRVREKWIGVVFSPLGILVIALGGWIIRTTPEKSLGGFVVVLGFLLTFGSLWLT